MSSSTEESSSYDAPPISQYIEEDLEKQLKLNDGGTESQKPESCGKPQRMCTSPQERSDLCRGKQSLAAGISHEQNGHSTDDGKKEEDLTFEVAWDGENDPMNPHSMRKVKRWLIVIIISMGSTCV